MDRIFKSESSGGVKIGDCIIQGQVFLVLLASTQNGLQQAHDRTVFGCMLCYWNENQFNKNRNHMTVQTIKTVLSPN